jgi:hypothetical protein
LDHLGAIAAGVVVVTTTIVPVIVN